MARFDGEDCRRNAPVRWVGNVLVGAGVSRDTDVLDACSEADKRSNVRVRKFVLAGGNTVVAESG